MARIRMNENTGFFQQGQTVFETRAGVYKFFIHRHASWESNGEPYVVHFLVLRGEVGKNPYDSNKELPWLRNEKLLWVCGNMAEATKALKKELKN